jgi:hypothetical protein
MTTDGGSPGDSSGERGGWSVAIDRNRPRRGLPEPLHLDGGPRALSRALDEIRGNR